ncbi:hypothetical protein Lal_00045268, partial [Lupinus albus]
MRKDPKFGGGAGGTYEVAKNQTQHSPRVEFRVVTVHKNGFSIDPRDRHTYKHRTNRPTAPADQPEPANPNPSEFHAQSSSCAVMPSNQMIMDELFSLRGYIPNRMDALDAQNQQIQFEFHRFYSKMSIMDIDEDRSGPESLIIF